MSRSTRAKTLTPDDRSQDFAAFTAMSQEAKDEIDQYANLNVAAISGPGIANLSGRAIELLRQPGMAELGPICPGDPAMETANLSRDLVDGSAALEVGALAAHGRE